MKTSKKDREQIRGIASDYTGLGSLGIAPMLVVRLLDDLDTQESELTKLRKRVEVLEKALNECAAWSENREVDSGFDEPGAAKTAREALAESAKIAEQTVE